MDQAASSRLPTRRMFTARPDQAELPAAYALGATYIEMKVPDDQRAASLFEWWIHQSFEDFVATVPKMLEYGGNEEGPATDLLLIGRNLAELLDMHDAPDSVLMEIGCWFYMQGKVARLVSDYKQKRAGKSDTWFDVSVYAKMARRIQEVGQWP